jgi:hypothetical protein
MGALKLRAVETSNGKIADYQDASPEAAADKACSGQAAPVKLGGFKPRSLEIGKVKGGAAH